MFGFHLNLRFENLRILGESLSWAGSILSRTILVKIKYLSQSL